MPSLIRPTSHGNNISVIHIPSLNIIRKSTTSTNSLPYLYNEYRGIFWYSGRRFSNAPPRVSAPISFGPLTYLDIPLYPSTTKIPYTLPISCTAPYILAAFEHYFASWPKAQTVSFHGDLTLSNIIFSHNNPIIIDWEHFSSSDLLPWGFDLLYLLLSALLLPTNSHLNPANLPDEFFYLLRLLATYGMDLNILSRPISSIQEAILNNKHLSTIALDSPRKFFPLMIPLDYATSFDDFVSKVSL